MLEWLVRLLNVSFEMEVVHMDWRDAYIVPLYNGKGDKCECSYSRGISLLSVVSKQYGRVLLKELGPELNLQYERINVGLGRIEDSWTKCFP